MIYHGVLSCLGSELSWLASSRKSYFLYRWEVSNTPIENRFYATLFENVERVASLRGAAKTQLDHPLDCSLDCSRRGPHPSSSRSYLPPSLPRTGFLRSHLFLFLISPLTTLGRRVGRPHPLAYSSRELASGIIAEKVCVAHRDL